MMISVRRTLLLLLTLCCSYTLIADAVDKTESEIDWASALYVSTTGDDSAEGTCEKPLATVKKALSKLPDSGEGVIALLGGVYSEQVSISKPTRNREVGHLIVTAAPGELVIVEGGKRADAWTSYRDDPSLYVIEAPNRQNMFSAVGYTDVWESKNRIRYRRQHDVTGVQAFAGSYTPLDETRILVHPRDGKTPESADLWHNQQAYGWGIHRDKVILRDLHFRNYLGGSTARALSVGGVSTPDFQQIVFQGCSVENSVIGISMTPHGAKVLDCVFRDVALGIVNYGTDTVVRNCVILGAAGAFAITDLNQHERDGIRYYYEANGGEISGNVVTGFWAGFYYKSNTASDESRPMLVSNNLFISPIVAGIGAPQPKTRYLNNILGPSNAGGLNAMRHEYCYSAEIFDNYAVTNNGKYFAATPVAITYKGREINPGRRENNQIGESPFVDLIEGDLRLRPEVHIPSYEGTVQRPNQVKWTQETKENLVGWISPTEKSLELSFLGEPTSVRSEYGALISVKSSVRSQGVLYYREKGAKEWQQMKGVNNTPQTVSTDPHATGIVHPGESIEVPEGVLFVLDREQLPETEYEYKVELISEGEKLSSSVQELVDVVGSKTIFVQSSVDSERQDGTREHPFDELQSALNIALPGDTIHVGKGVYKNPSILSHGGVEGAPITIRGEGPEHTILDGGKLFPYLLQMEQANYVHISGMQVRGFQNAGIQVTNSEHVSLHDNYFLNASLRSAEGDNGEGIFLRDSPHATISHNLFIKLEHGLSAMFSPKLTLTHNTGYRNTYSAVSLYGSLEGSTVSYNSFNFTGNDDISMQVKEERAIDSAVVNYNNYGTKISKAYSIRPEAEIVPSPRYGSALGASSGGKAILSYSVIKQESRRFNRMEDWREFSGQDANSVFADPEYADPMNMDFRVLPGSPNILPSGKVMGAFPVLE